MTPGSPSHQLTRADLVRAQVALIGSTFIALIGQFMLSPWLVFQLEGRGISASLIGWFSAASWLGLLLTTPFATQIVRAMGQRRALLLSLAVPLLTAIGITQTEHLLWWAGLSFLSGGAMSIRWIVAEACIAELAPDKRRGRIVSFYQTLLSVAFILAPSLLAWIKPTNPNAPWVAVAFLATGLAITCLVPRLTLADHSQEQSGFVGLMQAVRNNPAIVVAGFLGGIFELGITSLLPVYGLALGFASSTAALLIAASGAGSMMVMMPVGEAADRFAPHRIRLFLVSLILLTSLSALGVSSWPWLLWGLAFLWGAGGGALYTVSMISLGRVARGSALISATAVLVLSYTSGGLIGPIIAGSSIDLSLTWGLGLVAASIAVSALLAIARTR
ncbi:MAG: MFS transporter [Burkholderiaceae bacterium]